MMSRTRDSPDFHVCTILAEIITKQFPETRDCVINPALEVLLATPLKLSSW